MNTTKILGEAVGIQRQDIIDRTEEQTADGLTGAVILGRFKRGRVDALMEIHLGNIRGQLGYDPKNPDYIAVQDCLDTGVPSVQVLRLKGGCVCNSNYMDIPYHYEPMSYGATRYELIVNGTKYSAEDSVNEINTSRGLDVLFTQYDGLSDILRLSSNSAAPSGLQNLTNACLTLKMTAQYKNYNTNVYDPEVNLIPTTSLCAFVPTVEI